MRRLAGLAAINGAFVLLMAALSPHFLTAANLNAILSNMALESIVLAGLTLLLIAGLFDLSVDGTVAMSGVVCGKLLMAGWHPAGAILAALCSGVAVGYANGILVSKLRINPLIATLGVWWVMLGIAYGVTKAISPFGFPESFQAIGQARIAGVRVFVWYAVAIVAALSWVLSETTWGRHIYVIGGNRDAARLCGVNVERLGIGLYILMALLAAFIGVVMAARLNAGSPNATDGMTMRVIAAAVIGGCALSGGRGNIINGILGLLLMNMMTNAATLLGVSPYWQKALIGSVLLAAVCLDVAGGNIRFRKGESK